MAFDSLSDRLNKALRNVAGKGTLTDNNMEDMLKEIEEEKKNKDKTIKFSIKSTLFFTGLLIYILSPIGLVWYKVNQYKQITTNKEYTLTKKGKILTINSENQFLPSTDLEIIYDDEKEIQVKVDNDLYTIDKQSEKIKEK